MQTSQAQQTVLAISSYLINLLFNTGNAYHKTFRLKAYGDTLKKHRYGILDYVELDFFHPPIFKQLVSIVHISKWDLTVFRWYIAMPEN